MGHRSRAADVAAEGGRALRAALAISLGGWALTGCACASGTELTITSAGAELGLCAEVAETEAERMRGLQGAEPLAPGEALLLPFPVEDRICIVNGGVGFAIDVLYASTDGTVVAIERGVPAGDETPRCHDGVRRVVETAASQLDGVSVGDALRI